MELSERFDDALQWVSELHRTQRRKGSAIPYLTHLMSVASLLLEHGGDEDQAIAALLHDSIEDQGATDEEIAQRYGDRVATIVRGCTDADTVPKPPWEGRKRAYIAHLREASPDVLLVSLADKTHNARTLAADVAREGETYLERFNGGAAGTRWYYRRLADVFEQRQVELTHAGAAADGRGLVVELHRVLDAFGATPAAADAYDGGA